MPYDKLCRLFGSDMLNDATLLSDFDGLVGFSPVKPFECVGTVDEIVFALQCTAQKFLQTGRPLPVLLAHFIEHGGAAMLRRNLELTRNMVFDKLAEKSVVFVFEHIVVTNPRTDENFFHAGQCTHA